MKKKTKMISPSFEQTDTRYILDALDALPNSETILARLDSQENKWTLYDVYKVAPNHQLEMCVFGWINGWANDENSTAQNEWQSRAEFSKMKSRKNLNGIHLRCGSFVSTENT